MYVINDPFGQTHSPARSSFSFEIGFALWDFEKMVRTDTTWKNNDHYQTWLCESASWINKSEPRDLSV